MPEADRFLPATIGELNPAERSQVAEHIGAIAALLAEVQVEKSPDANLAQAAIDTLSQESTASHIAAVLDQAEGLTDQYEASRVYIAASKHLINTTVRMGDANDEDAFRLNQAHLEWAFAIVENASYIEPKAVGEFCNKTVNALYVARDHRGYTTGRAIAVEEETRQTFF